MRRSAQADLRHIAGLAGDSHRSDAVQPAPVYRAWRRVSPYARQFLGELLSGEVYEIESEQPSGLVRRLVLNEPARVRRITAYPLNWRSLDDAGLLALFAPS